MAASARARAASFPRREARSTTVATPIATATYTSRATRFDGSATVNLPTGGVKNQFSRRNPPTAAASAGSIPPISATRTVAARNSRTVERQPVLVVQPGQHQGEGDGDDEGGDPAGELPARAERGER